MQEVEPYDFAPIAPSSLTRILTLLGSVLLLSGHAHGQVPTVTTLPPQNVTWRSADLLGEVHPNGLETEVRFEFGVSAGGNLSMHSVGTVPAGDPTTAVSFDANHSPGATYVYRLVAENSAGVSYGEFQTVNVPASLSPLLTHSVTRTTASSFRNQFEAQPRGEATVVKLQSLGTNPSGPILSESTWDVPADATSVSSHALIANINPNTTYHYRYVAENSKGSLSNDFQITTPAVSVPEAIPSPAEEISASEWRASCLYTTNGVAPATVRLAWAQADDNGTFGFDVIHHSTWTRVLADHGHSQADWSLPNLPPASTFRFRFIATNARGTTYSDYQTFKTAHAAPEIVSNSASFGRTVVELAATVDPNGEATGHWFEWGEDPVYTQSTPPVLLPDLVRRNVTEAIEDLDPDTRYICRSVAQNSLGITYGTPFFFTTRPKVVPEATTQSGQALTSSTARLTGIADSNDPTYNDAQAFFEWGTTLSLGNVTPETPLNSEVSPHQADISGLQPGLPYFFRLVVRNESATHSGAIESFLIPTPDEPAQVETLPAYALGTDLATLGGTANPSGVETTVYFEWGLTQAYGNQTPVQSIGAGVVPVSLGSPLTGLLANTTYHFRYVATNSYGTIVGDNQSFTTLDPHNEISGGDIDLQAPFVLGTGRHEFRGSTLTPGDSSDQWNIQHPENLAITSVEWYYDRSDPNNVQGATTFTVNGNQLEHFIPPGPSQHAVIHSGFNRINPSYPLPGPSHQFRVLSGVSFPAAHWTVIVEISELPTTVETLDPTDAGPFEVVLNGSVVPNGADTSVYFEWRTSTAYGSSTTPNSVGNGTSPQAFSSISSQLIPGTTYHYRAVASNSRGTVYGEDRSFVTPPNVPEVETQVATDVTFFGATLKGNALRSPDGAQAYFEYELTDGYGRNSDSVALSPTTSSQSFQEPVSLFLYPETTYHYRAAMLIDGVTYYGADATFTTLPAPSLAVETLATSEEIRGQVSLNGSVDSMGLDLLVWFEYGPTDSYGWNSATSPLPQGIGSVNFDETINLFLEPSTTYHYRACALRGNQRWHGPDRTFTTRSGPALAETEAATVISSNSAQLNGNVDGQGLDLLAWYEYGPTDSYGWFSTSSSVSASGGATPFPSQISQFLQPNTTYHYRLATQNNDERWYGQDMTFTTLPPDANVQTLAVTELTPHSVTLNASIEGFGINEVLSFFQYGPTDAYSWSTSSPVVDISGGATPVSQTVSLFLQPNTTYHFRAGIQWNSEFRYGSDMTFTTPPLPPDFESMSSLTDTETVLTGSGTEGYSYRIEFSENLTDWIEIGTSSSNGSGWEFRHEHAADLERGFYRVLE